MAKSLGTCGNNIFLCITTNLILKFTPTTYTLITNVNLVWDDFTDFYAMIFSSETLESYAFLKYLGLTYFLKSWDSYKQLNFIPLVSHNSTPSSCWRLRPRGKGFP